MHTESKTLHNNYILYVYNIPTPNCIKGTAFYCALKLNHNQHNIFGR